MNISNLTANIMIFLFCLSTPSYSVYSQEFLPAPVDIDTVNIATIYGVGGISTGNGKEDKSADPSSKVVLDYNISSRFNFYSVFNIGSGLESSVETVELPGGDSISRSELDINSIFFPEDGDIGGMAGGSYALRRKVVDNVRMKELALFGEWSFQKREGTKSAEELKFFVATTKLGFKFTAVERFDVGNGKFQTFKFMGGVYFTRINITDGTEDDFQKLFGDKKLLVKFSGFGVKIGFQYNSFIYEMDLQQVEGHGDRNSEEATIGEKFSIKISAAGVGLALGRMPRKAQRFNFGIEMFLLNRL